MGLDLILYWKTHNYWKVILLNLKMLFCAWWPIFLLFKKDSIIQNLFPKLSIFKTESSSSEIWDCQWHIIFSLTSVFTALILLLLFQIIKIRQFVVLLSLIFTVTYAFATSWVTFPNTRMISYFFLFFHLIFPW